MDATITASDQVRRFNAAGSPKVSPSGPGAVPSGRRETHSACVVFQLPDGAKGDGMGVYIHPLTLPIPDAVPEQRRPGFGPMIVAADRDAEGGRFG